MRLVTDPVAPVPFTHNALTLRAYRPFSNPPVIPPSNLRRGLLSCSGPTTTTTPERRVMLRVEANASRDSPSSTKLQERLLEQFRQQRGRGLDFTLRSNDGCTPRVPCHRSWVLPARCLRRHRPTLPCAWPASHPFSYARLGRREFRVVGHTGLEPRASRPRARPQGTHTPQRSRQACYSRVCASPWTALGCARGRLALPV